MRTVGAHFHMPLQSGSDRVLAAMHRWYRAEHYARRAELGANGSPTAAIGADVIAGFPGETEEDHRATLALIGPAAAHLSARIFVSPRPGTPAAEMPDHVPDRGDRAAARELRALGEEKKSAVSRRAGGLYPARADAPSRWRDFGRTVASMAPLRQLC